MFDNISCKIKAIAWIEFVVGVIASLISGIVMMFLGNWFVLYGGLCIVLGCFVAFVLAVLIYGFGELIERTVRIEYLVGRGVFKNLHINTSVKLPLEKVAKLYSDGQITEEEYLQAFK